MIKLLEEIATDVPHFALLTSISLAILFGQILFLLGSLKQRKYNLALEDAARAGDWARVASAGCPRTWPTVIWGLSVLAIPALAVWSLADARALLFPGMTDGDPYAKAESISRGLGGMFNVLPLTINILVPSVLLVTFSLSLRLIEYRRRQRLARGACLASSDPDAALAHLAHRLPSADGLAAIPLSFLALGLFPVVSGAWAHTIRVLKGFGAVKDLPPEGRGAALLATLDEAHAFFAARAWLAYPGTAIAILVSAVLLIRWRRHQAGVPVPPSSALSWRTSLVLSASCLLAALACFALAAPFRAENNLPWLPPRLTGDTLQVHLPSAPQLQGPDEVEGAPLLHQVEQGIALDGYHMDVSGIEDALRTARRAFRLLHPDDRFTGKLLVLLSADAPMRSLRPWLTAAARAGYRNPLFTFTKRETQRRPIIGTLTRVLATAARATLLVDDDSEGVEGRTDVVLVHEKDFANYDQLARRLVELRRAGKEVSIRL